VRIAAALLILLPGLAAPALTQDCGHATGAVRHAICTSADLLDTEVTLDRAYHLMMIALRDGARDHLVTDQRRWREARDRACPEAPQGLEPCLQKRYADRSVNLAAMAVSPYPFVGERVVVAKASIGDFSYVVDASYPQFDVATGDFAEINRHFAQSVRERIDEVTSGAHLGLQRPTTWSYRRSMRLYRPSPKTIAIEAEDYIFTGAHGNGGTTGTLVDLQTGRAIAPADVFVAGDQWLRAVAEIATPEVLSQLRQRGALGLLDQDEVVRRLRSGSGQVMFRNEALVVHFNRDDIAAYTFGTFTVEVPYSRLRAVLRPGGPVTP